MTMKNFCDGPASSLFSAVALEGNCCFEDIKSAGVSKQLADAVGFAHRNTCIAWGIPFEIGRPVVLRNEPIALPIAPTKAAWFVFMHTSDSRPNIPDRHGLVSPTRGEGQLGEHAADYVFVYEDGSEERAEIRRRQHIGSFLFR